MSTLKPNFSSPALQERGVIVVDQTARFALTAELAQNGDTVIETATGSWFLVIDQTKLNSADGYRQYPSGITVGNNDTVPFNLATKVLRFDKASGFLVSEDIDGAALVALGSHFKTIHVSGQDDVVAVGEDAFTLAAGSNVTITTDATTKTVTIAASGGGSNGPIDGLSDVDTTTVTPTKNDSLKWNGTSWVPAAYDYSFVFSLASFTVQGENTEQLIGDSATVWRTAGTLDFRASYLNGPPTTAYITSTGWVGQLNVPSPGTQVYSAQDVLYPAARDTAISFTLFAQNSESGTLARSITFRNNLYFGASAHSGAHTGSELTVLTSRLGNGHASTFSVNATSGNYIVYAHPSSYTSMHTTGFLFNGIACPFSAASTVSVTNSLGFTELYKYYVSQLPSLGSGTLTTSTSSILVNPIYWGVSTSPSGITEAIVEGLGGNAISNTKGRSFTVTAGPGQYIVYALPERLGTVVFSVGGFEGGFNSPEIVSITNANGYAENYRVYVSSNANLGATTVVVA